MTAEARRNGGRLTAVDALRGLAALAVLAIHVPHVRPPEGGRKQLLFLPAEYGTQGVTLFLVISGLCIHLGAARALARGQGARCDWAAFWRRRFRRLYPPYLAAILLTLLIALVLYPNYAVLWPRYESGQVKPVWDVLTHLLMAHNLFNDYAAGLGNGAFWTLGLEEQLYALYAVLLLLRGWLSAWGALAVTGVVSLLWYVAAFACPWWPAGQPFALPLWPFMFWVDWALGALAAEAYAGAITLPRWCYSAGVGLALAGVGALLNDPIPRLLHVERPLAALLGDGHLLVRLAAQGVPAQRLSEYFFAGAFFVLLNRWVGGEAAGVAPGRVRRALAGVGVMSYSLYLTHLPVLALLLRIEFAFVPTGFTLSNTGTMLRYVADTAICLGVALAFFLGVERHFLNSRQAAPAPAVEGQRAAA